MKLLITPAEVIDTAFSEQDQIDRNTVDNIRIEAAQLKFIAPVLGNLYERLSEKRYAEFSRLYLKPALAYYVKYNILIGLSVNTGNMGIIRMKTTYFTTASDNEISVLRKETRKTAHSFMEKAMEYIESHPEEFPDYQSDTPYKDRPRIVGGMII